MPDVMGIGTGEAVRAETQFKAELLAMVAPRVLELGTMRSEAPNPTHHQEWAPQAKEYVMSDFADGLDVDVIADAHDLKPFKRAYFDALIAVSVWEHLTRPWIAAQAVGRVVKPGGIIFICTHQTFPLHGYPNDYFRFSSPALGLIFEDAGFEILEAGYQYPCSIHPPAEVTRWNDAAESFLNVAVFARRV